MHVQHRFNCWLKLADLNQTWLDLCICRSAHPGQAQLQHLSSSCLCPPPEDAQESSFQDWSLLSHLSNPWPGWQCLIFHLCPPPEVALSVSPSQSILPTTEDVTFINENLTLSFSLPSGSRFLSFHKSVCISSLTSQPSRAFFFFFLAPSQYVFSPDPRALHMLSSCL